MNKLRIAAAVVTIIALTAVSGAAKKPGSPSEGSTEIAVFGPVPDGTMDIASDTEGVVVGTDVQTYSPNPIELFLSEQLVSGTLIDPGSYWGKARCLKKNGPEGGRLDFYFDCTGDDLSSCRYRLIVRYGIYDRKNDVDLFDPGSMLIYRTGVGELVKEGDASFSIAFPE